jgi:hypothetical protein
MMADKEKIDQILQYALLVSGQGGEWFERALSPIHLIKYLYLADMDHAKFNNGETFTGIDWKFHHFGPWSVEAFLQLDEALSPLGAEKQTFQSNYGDKDYTRWSVRFDEEKFNVLKRQLPLGIKQSVQHYVGNYRNNTTALLHFVYATPPMLNAAPEESLDFTSVVVEKREAPEAYVPYIERLSSRKKKKLKQGMGELRERFMQKVAESREYPSPDSSRVDAVYEEGMAWLDGLAGEPFPEQGATVHFSDEIWKSAARRGDV